MSLYLGFDLGLNRRRSGVLVACGLLALGGLATAAAPSCRAAENTGKTVTIDVADADFHAVVGMLERQANVEAVVRDGDTPYKRINVHLEDASLAKALRTIAFSAGAKVIKNDDDVYVFEPEGAASDTAPTSPAQSSPQSQYAGAANQQSGYDNPEARFPPGSLHYQTIVLQHAVPSDILKLMHWDRDLVELEPFKPLNIPQARPVLSATESNLTPLSQNNGYNGYNSGYNSGYPSVPTGTGNAGPAGANYAAHRSADSNSPDQANQFPGGGFGGGGFNGGGFNGGGFNGGGFNGGGFNGGGVNPFQQQPGQPGGANGNRQQAQLPDGVARIYALQSNNSLLVEATPEGYNQIKQIVKILDVAPRQVEIKVEFVTASVTDVDALGINFDLVPFPGAEVATSQGSGAFGGSVSSVSPTFLQYATGNIVAQLFQTLTRTRGKVVQAPLITTTNNVTATISINTQIPFFTTTAIATGNTNGGGAQAIQGQQANFLTLQTGLTITPRINSDDSVTMNLNPQITDTTGQASVNGIPPTIQQTLTTLRTVRSGETMVLGGLVRKQETASSQRIPILSDIPYLGGLFRTRNKQVNDQELLIFVTPTIIGDTNDNSAAANTPSGQNVTVSP